MPQFDVLLNDFYRLTSEANHKHRIILMHRREMRRLFYRAGVKVKQMRDQDNARFMAEARSHPQGIDGYLADHFESLRALGENYHDLLRDIGEGMTEKEYLNRAPGAFAREKRLATKKDLDRPRPELDSKPAEALSFEQRAQYYHAQCDGLRDLVAQLKSRVHELERLAADQERRIADYERRVARVQRSLAAARK